MIAGNDVALQAGRDTTLVASKITAGNEAYLYSGNAHVVGEVIKLALGERDGKLKLAVID